jgi:hypothetical protein
MDRDIVVRGGDPVLVGRLTGRRDLDRKRARAGQFLRANAARESRKSKSNTGVRIAEAESNGGPQRLQSEKPPPFVLSVG